MSLHCQRVGLDLTGLAQACVEPDLSGAHVPADYADSSGAPYRSGHYLFLMAILRIGCYAGIKLTIVI
jgi:hypothetical protein